MSATIDDAERAAAHRVLPERADLARAGDDAAADGVLARKHPLGERLVDHHHRLGIDAVVAGEGASCDQRRGHRFQVAAADADMLCDGVVGGLRGPSFDLERHAPAGIQRQRRSGTCELHAGLRSDGFEQPVVRLVHSDPRRIGGLRQLHGRGHDAAGAHAGRRISIRETLRTRRADAMSTAQASATSVTTRRRFQRRPRAPVAPRLPSFNASDAWVRDRTSAGSSPNRWRWRRRSRARHRAAADRRWPPPGVARRRGARRWRASTA